ncbi:MAG TPA: ABC transporter permease [Gemmatimonadales bacterium]|nr:ABC transporter permease [Gemmatimonadales bacterium]
MTARLSAGRLWAMARKEWLHIRRDSRSLAMAFAVPAAMVILFGYVITFDVRDIRMAVLDQSHTTQSRDLVDAFRSSGYFRVARQLTSDDQISPLLVRGTVRLVLVIPPNFAKHLAAAEPAPVQALLDGGDANTASIAINYAQAIVTSYSATAVLKGVPLPVPIAVDSRVWYNEDLKSSSMIVPGLMAAIMMILSALLTSLTIAREWERGTMEQLAATPVHRLEVILGKLLPYLGIGAVDIVLVAVVGGVVFAVPFRGSPALLMITGMLFLVGAQGLGMFISASAKSQFLATQLAMIVTFLPAMLLSGLMFDISSMPKVLQIISLVVPARYFIAATRGIFLKGVGLEVLWGQALGMLVFALAGLGLAVHAFRKEIV